MIDEIDKEKKEYDEILALNEKIYELSEILNEISVDGVLKLDKNKLICLHGIIDGCLSIIYNSEMTFPFAT